VFLKILRIISDSLSGQKVGFFNKGDKYGDGF
jgi:hypothetical protein